MAQTYQMKHNPQGTIYSLLTVESDGQMTMTFHGTDREICHEVTENADGWLCYPGGMFPGLESGRWQLTEDVIETTNFTNYTNNHAKPEVIVETADCTDNEPEVIEETTTFAIKREHGDTCINHAEREQSQDCESSVNCTNNEPVIVNPAPLTLNQAKPKRQREPRKPRVERQTSSISHQTSSIDHQPSDIDRQPSATLKAVGMVAAATVALFVIYETGLLIPLGLIGLATGGILK